MVASHSADPAAIRRRRALIWGMAYWADALVAVLCWIAKLRLRPDAVPAALDP